MALVSYENNGYLTMILPNLYLGDIEASQNIDKLKNNNIKKIINLSNDSNYKKFDGIKY